MRVGLFVTCVADLVAPEVGRATARLLERLQCEVVFPREQTCCGQIHANSGYPDEARPLVRHFTEVFSAAELQAVVVPSGSCAAMIREQYPDLARSANDARLVAQLEALLPRVYELAEFLVDVLGVEDVGAGFPHRVGYHPSCHSMRALGVGDAPVRLLRAVRDLELVELRDADVCCGFGGTFSVKNADTSAAMLTDKLHAVLSSRVHVVCSLDASCLLQIGGGLSRQRSGVRTMHLAEILASSATDS